MTKDDMPLSGLRLGLFGRGGAGKSTATVLTADALRAWGYSVLILDADSTNVGLARALGIPRDPDPLLDYFGGMAFSGGLVTCPVDDPTPLQSAAISMREMPGRFVGRRDGLRLMVAGKLGVLGPGAGCDGPIAKIARDLVVEDLDPEHVVLVDFKAGLEDSARGAVTSLDRAVVVVDPTVAAIQMAIHLTAMVDGIRSGAPPATQHLLERSDLVESAIRLFRKARVGGVVAVLNRVPDPTTEAYLRVRLADAFILVVGCFGADHSVQDQWLRGVRVGSDDLAREAVTVVSELEAIIREENKVSRWLDGFHLGRDETALYQPFREVRKLIHYSRRSHGDA